MELFMNLFKRIFGPFEIPWEPLAARREQQVFKLIRLMVDEAKKEQAALIGKWHSHTPNPEAILLDGLLKEVGY
jgi:hypothetical protein